MGSNWNRMEQTRESFQKFFRYFRELSQMVQKNPPKKFPGTFPNFPGNFPQCNTAYRKYVSLYSNSSIENVHCRIVQMTKSNRKLQCIAYTHFEMFLLFVCRANSCRACAVGKIEFAVRPKCCLKIMPLTKSRKLIIWTSYEYAIIPGFTGSSTTLLIVTANKIQFLNFET